MRSTVEDLLLKQGYRVTSVDEVGRAAGLLDQQRHDAVIASMAWPETVHAQRVRALRRAATFMAATALVTAAVPALGYEAASDVAKEALATGRPVREIILEKGLLSADDLDPAVVEKERQIQIDIARESGKPEAVIERIVEGKMAKFIEDVCLLEQGFERTGLCKVSRVTIQYKAVGNIFTAESFPEQFKNHLVGYQFTLVSKRLGLQAKLRAFFCSIP